MTNTVRPRPLIELTAAVAASPEVVLAAVEAAIRAAGGGRIEVDRVRRTVAVQGGWWYRGEYEVEATAGGSRLTHRVRNVARRGRWAVPLANRLFVGYRARTSCGFTAFVRDLNVEFGGPERSTLET
ncbi:hypothetical protein FHX81_2528 [Saccharothrix saharensis]|uniref:Uncharacterized protein n=1 Tax=Saccharothrix saharensis TaxID=571190 RepID=A0A543JBI7_9PSEU|nr:hypothetical protein [Saccharothrix saharensis]TQM80200.1 hypothetical protein FHX81_2528 [Saccharothrix saharensis]